MRRFFRTAAAAILALGLPTMAHSQTVVASNPASLVSAMRAAGYKAEIIKDEAGMVTINSRASATDFQIFFFGCTNYVNCATVQFFAGLGKYDKVTLAWINDWNSRKRYVRAYLTNNGAARLEMDVDLDVGGMSRALFQDYLDLWTMQVTAFEVEAK